MRCKPAGFPSGKMFATRNAAISLIPKPTQAPAHGSGVDLAQGEPGGLRSARQMQVTFLGIYGPIGDQGWTQSLLVLAGAVGRLLEIRLADDSLDKAVHRVLKSDPISNDDIGLLPVDQGTARPSYRKSTPPAGSAPLLFPLIRTPQDLTY